MIESSGHPSGRASAVPTPGKRTLTESLPPVSSDLFGRVQRKAASAEPDTAAIHATAQRGIAAAPSPLPHAETIQRAFGRHDISRIQAHAGADAAASAAEMGARAYATGNHVVLGSATDLHTVAHEAAHVVQQAGTVQLTGGVGQPGDRYEQHADAVADRVVAGGSAEALLDEFASPDAAGSSAGSQPPQSARAVQRVNVTTPVGTVLEIQRKLDEKHRRPPDQYIPLAVYYFNYPTTDGVDTWFPNAWTLEDCHQAVAQAYDQITRWFPFHAQLQGTAMGTAGNITLHITIVRSSDDATTIISAYPSQHNSNLVNVKDLLALQQYQQQEQERLEQQRYQQWLQSDAGQYYLQQYHQQRQDASLALLLTNFPELQQAWTADAGASPSHDAPAQGDPTVAPASLLDSAPALELSPDVQTQPPSASATRSTAGHKRKLNAIPPASGRGVVPERPPATRDVGSNPEPKAPRNQGHAKRLRSERGEGAPAERDALPGDREGIPPPARDGIHVELTSEQVTETFGVQPSSLREGARYLDSSEQRAYCFVRREAGIFSLRNATWKFRVLS